MNKDWIYNYYKRDCYNDYKKNDMYSDFIKNDIKNEYKYDFDSGYYRTYGNISSNDILLNLSSTEITQIRDALSALDNNQFRRLSDAIVAARNLGITITSREIIILAKEIVLADLTNNRIVKQPVSTQTVADKEKIEKEKQERERLEKQSKEDFVKEEVDNKERLERERQEKEEQAKRVINKFMQDIMSKKANSNFRGWVLPNGLLMSQYNETDEAYSSERPRRQDHSSLVSTFMSGLEEYDKDSFETMKALYEEYQKFNGVSADISESFAVERLGWMQVSVCGLKTILYRAERWQDRILKPFFEEYGFRYNISDSGRSYEMEFAHLYDHMDEIMQLGLRKKYERVLK